MMILSCSIAAMVSLEEEEQMSDVTMWIRFSSP